MKFKMLILAALLTFSASAFAQDVKIGYADIQAVLVRMPETSTMNQAIATYQQKLTERLQTKQQYAQTKLEEFYQLQENGAAQEELEPLAEELQELDKEIQEAAAKADQNLAERRATMLEPIINKLQENIDAIAAAEGYNFIISKVDGTGSSMILYGPEENDVTLKLMERLGIEIDGQ